MENKPEAPENEQVEQQPGVTLFPGNKMLHQEESTVVAKDGLDEGSQEHYGAGYLTTEHREYLLSRHKTIDLNPLPTMDPADPLNWSSLKVLYSPSRKSTTAERYRKISTCSSSHFTQ
jgi:hypothetical protein